MNVAFFLIPKLQVKYVKEENTIEDALEKMHKYGYTAIPVLDGKGRYVGTISEGDFLWYIVSRLKESDKDSFTSEEGLCVKDLMKERKNSPINITTSMEELLVQATQQNFVPVVDDDGIFVGIVTRHDIIKYYAERRYG